MVSSKMKPNDGRLVGIFIDHENIEISIKENLGGKNKRYDIEKVVERAKENGQLVVGKVYIIHTRGSTSEYYHKFYENGIEPVYTPKYLYEEESKSLADPMMICDIMETLYERPKISVFLLLTNDKDFIPVIRKLAEHGKKVILMVVKGKSLAADLVEECNNRGFPVEDIPVFNPNETHS